MKHLLILGGGTAGTMMANKLQPVLKAQGWQVTIVDNTEEHYYQPGFMFVPFGVYRLQEIVRPRRQYLPSGVKFVQSSIDHIETDKNRVILKDQSVLPYDYLIIATGTDVHPEQTEGLVDEDWGKNKFDFYTPKGADLLGQFLKGWQGGRMVVNPIEMPIKCPVAPLEFLFLADAYFTEKGIRDKVEICLVTPLPGAFTRPKAAEILGDMLQRKGIEVIPDFGLARVDSKEKKLVSWEDTEVKYDLLVSVPLNLGDPCIGRSGMGDVSNFVPTEKETLLAKGLDNVFVIGDATNLPTSKAGSVVHFQSDVLYDNFLEHIENRPMPSRFDGHSNCFIETGFGKAMLIDFNYDVEPLPGDFPLPGIGPFPLLKESSVNHYGKLMFRWMYWNILLRGLKLPMDPEMSMAGKRV
uniref:FAD-dependent pyridine nucleotide-disulphide oxidoreductase n=1 Tax=mine drainage metagenome TaxID=410659 RepID=E6QHM3_9ZZZZ